MKASTVRLFSSFQDSRNFFRYYIVTINEGLRKFFKFFSKSKTLPGPLMERIAPKETSPPLFHQAPSVKNSTF